jgi:hypothetical protein
MVYRDQVLINPSSTNILSHTSRHVFYIFILENIFSYNQIDFIDIQYLEVALDQFYLDYKQVINIEPS